MAFKPIKLKKKKNLKLIFFNLKFNNLRIIQNFPTNTTYLVYTLYNFIT
jgi:hypothetical protein